MLWTAPDATSPNHRRYFQGFHAAISTAMTAKSHFNVPSRHLFETNEHLVNENLSPCNWRMSSSMRSEATRVAATGRGEDFGVMSRGQRERNKHRVTCWFRLWFYSTVCPRAGLWGCRSARVDAFVEPEFGASLSEYAALYYFHIIDTNLAAGFDRFGTTLCCRLHARSSVHS